MSDVADDQAVGDGVDDDDLTDDDLTDDGSVEEDETPEEPAGGDLPAPPKRGRIALVVSLIMLLVVGALVVVLATSDKSADRVADTPLAGRPMPPLEGETIDGGSFGVDDYDGKWVVVNFFAEWCVPCREEHPELVAFDELYSDDDVVLVSVVFDNPDSAEAFFEEQGGDWPVLRDDDGQISFDFGVARVPETYIVAPNGVVQTKMIGGVTRAGIEAQIAQIQEEGWQ